MQVEIEKLHVANDKLPFLPFYSSTIQTKKEGMDRTKKIEVVEKVENQLEANSGSHKSMLFRMKIKFNSFARNMEQNTFYFKIIHFKQKHIPFW